MTDMIWAGYILVAGLSGVLVLDVCTYLLSAEGRYDLWKRRTQGER